MVQQAEPKPSARSANSDLISEFNTWHRPVAAVEVAVEKRGRPTTLPFLNLKRDTPVDGIKSKRINKASTPCAGGLS